MSEYVMEGMFEKVPLAGNEGFEAEAAGNWNMNKNPTIKTVTPMRALMPCCVLTSRKMKAAPMTINAIASGEAPKRPNPKRAKAITTTPANERTSVGWKMSTRIAKTPTRKRRLDTFGSLKIEMRIELTPGVLIGVLGGTPSADSDPLIEFVDNTPSTTWNSSAEGQVRVPFAQ